MHYRAYRTDLVTQPDGINAGVLAKAGGRTGVREQPDGTTLVGAFSLAETVGLDANFAFLTIIILSRLFRALQNPFDSIMLCPDLM